MKLITITANGIDHSEEIITEQIVGVQPANFINSLVDYHFNQFKWSTMTNLKKRAIHKQKTINNLITFMNFVLLKYHKRKESTDEYVKKYANFINIHSKHRWEKFFRAQDVKKYQQILEELNVLKKQSDTYKLGSHSKAFILQNSYIHTLEYYIIIDDENYNNMNVDSKHVEVEDGVVLDEREMLALLTMQIDKQQAINAEIKHFFDNKTKVSSLICRINAIILFGKLRYLKLGNKSSRRYSHLCNLSRIARKYLLETYYNIDITNCQPTLLLYKMFLDGVEVDKNYKEAVESGTIYEQFQFLYGDRQITKKEFYSQVLFDFKKWQPLNIFFKKYYPKVWKYLDNINEEKKMGGDTLASILQTIETEIFSDVFDACVLSTKITTLHDSVYFNDERDTKLIIGHLNAKFDAYGIKVKYNVE